MWPATRATLTQLAQSHDGRIGDYQVLYRFSIAKLSVSPVYGISLRKGCNEYFVPTCGNWDIDATAARK